MAKDIILVYQSNIRLLNCNIVNLKFNFHRQLRAAVLELFYMQD